MEHREANRESSQAAGADVHGVVRAKDRRWITHALLDARDGLPLAFIAAPRCPRTAAVAVHRGINDVRLPGADLVVANAVALRRTRWEILQDDVAALQELPEHLLPGARLHVEQDAAFAAVQVAMLANARVR